MVTNADVFPVFFYLQGCPVFGHCPVSGSFLLKTPDCSVYHQFVYMQE